MLPSDSTTQSRFYSPFERSALFSDHSELSLPQPLRLRRSQSTSISLFDLGAEVLRQQQRSANVICFQSSESILGRKTRRVIEHEAKPRVGWNSKDTLYPSNITDVVNSNPSQIRRAIANCSADWNDTENLPKIVLKEEKLDSNHSISLEKEEILFQFVPENEDNQY